MYTSTKSHSSKSPIIVGFNTGHHGGCAVMKGGQLVAVSEERLTRRKYSDGYENSFFYCLNALGVKVNEIDLFVSSSYHKRLESGFQGSFQALGLPKEKFITVDHHLSHACSGYLLSSFDEALIIVIDGLGNDTDTESYYLGRGNSITKIGGNDSKRSIYQGIGRAYEVFTNFCGWSAQEAGKTMGLASFGVDKYPDIPLYEINQEQQVNSLINGKYLQGAQSFVESHSLDFGQPERGCLNKDAAYFVQDRTKKIVVELVQGLMDRFKVRKICLVGGVFLNSVINGALLEETDVEEMFIPPCCDDSGQPVGNALYGHCLYLGNPRPQPLTTAYLGRSYSNEEVEDAAYRKQAIYSLPYHAKCAKLQVVQIEDVAKHAARLLFEGKTIGWFQGKSEIGPRALGNRSILSAPFPLSKKDYINEVIKRREMFRPFAPSILAEHVSKYFNSSTSSPFMLLVAEALDQAKELIPAALHVDGTGRLQTVTKEDNSLYYSLIEEFFRLSGIPVLLNTSFNDNSEPIVENPRDALSTFCRTPLDALIMGSLVITKGELCAS